MKNIIPFFAFIFLLWGCENETSSKRINFPKEVQTMYCFAGQQEGEEYWLRFYVEEEQIIGLMEFILSDGVKKVGSLEGRLEGDTIFADLSIQEQELFINREVAFLMTEQGLQEGKGKQVMGGNKMIFSDSEKIIFGENMILKPKDCGSK